MADFDMQEMLQAMYQAFGAPGRAIPGLNPHGDPYQFQYGNAATALGVPPSMMQGHQGQMVQQLAPLMIQLAFGKEASQRLTRNNRAHLSNISRGRQTQRTLGALNEVATGAMSQNLGNMLTASGGYDMIKPLLDGLGMDDTSAQDVASGFMQIAPLIDPSIMNMLNRLDPAGGALGLDHALYQSLSNRSYGKIPGATLAKSYGKEFVDAYTRRYQNEEFGIDAKVLDMQKTAGFTMPQMAMLHHQMRAYDMLEDPMAGASGSALLRTLAERTGGSEAAGLRELAESVDSGELSESQALSKARESGYASHKRITDTRNEIMEGNMERASDRTAPMARNLQRVGSVFETISDNIPALMDQLQKMVDRTQMTDEGGIRRAIANYQALVEISGTTAEQLDVEAKEIQRRLGTSYNKSTELAATFRAGAEEMTAAGYSKKQIETAYLQTEAHINNTAESLNFQRQVKARTIASEDGRAALDKARQVLENPAEYSPQENADARAAMADPIRYLIDKGYLNDQTTVNEADQMNRDLVTDRSSRENILLQAENVGYDVLEHGRNRASEIRSNRGLKIDRLQDLHKGIRDAAANAGESIAGVGAMSVEDSMIMASMLKENASPEDIAAFYKEATGELMSDDVAAFLDNDVAFKRLGDDLAGRTKELMAIGRTAPIQRANRRVREEKEKSAERISKQLTRTRAGGTGAGLLEATAEAASKYAKGDGTIISAAKEMLIAGGEQLRFLLTEEDMDAIRTSDLTVSQSGRLMDLREAVTKLDPKKDKKQYDAAVKAYREYASDLTVGLAGDPTNVTVGMTNKRMLKEAGFDLEGLNAADINALSLTTAVDDVNQKQIKRDKLKEEIKELGLNPTAENSGDFAKKSRELRALEDEIQEARAKVDTELENARAGKEASETAEKEKQERESEREDKNKRETIEVVVEGAEVIVKSQFGSVGGGPGGDRGVMSLWGHLHKYLTESAGPRE